MTPRKSKTPTVPRSCAGALTVALALLPLGCLQPGGFHFNDTRTQGGEGPSMTATPSRQVFVNGSQIADAQVAALEQAYQTTIVDGRYWYDRISGAIGCEGGPCAGFIAAGLPLGGTMQANCSGGGTGVFINGREAHRLDVIALQRLLPVAPGRYWVDAHGNAGYEGGPPLCNLVA